MKADPRAPKGGAQKGEKTVFSVPGYRVLGPIGRGGVSTVYLAEREADQCNVAIKLLDGRLQHTQNFLPRFVREQQIIARLESPSVVRILDHGFSDAFVYIVMEYLEGDDLSHYIRLGMRPRQALAVVYQAGLALRLIHAHGVIHRDIKPTNLMFRRDGSLVLVDFGFSKMAQDDPGLTRQGQVLGTPQYMSPEQAKGMPLDARTDLYSLGVVLYEMLTRRKLFAGGNAAPFDTRDKAPLPLLPQPLSGFQMLLEKLLARRREDRFASADDMLDYITRVWGVPRAKIFDFAERTPEGH